MTTSNAAALETPVSSTLLTRSEQRAFAMRLTLALIAGGCLIISVAIRMIFPELKDISDLVAGISAALVAVPALSAAWWSLRYPNLHGITDQLIALALIAAWASGDLVTAALLPLVMTIGHILEERSLLGSQEAIRALTRLTRTSARRILGDDKIVEIGASDLKPGDLIEVRAGDLIPADGEIETGSSSVDTASVTGESVPVEVTPGASVFSGSINIDGRLTIRVTRVGEQTTLGRVIALLQEAEQAKPPVTRLLERYAQRYLVLVLLVAAGAWFVTKSTTALLAVLVASCPCALVLAAPATSIAAIAVASRHGILVKGAAFLEQLATVNSVVFDKTGTITVGKLRLAELRPESGITRDELVRVAASLAVASSHPVSRAIAQAGGDGAASAEIREVKGLGVAGLLDGEQVALGRAALFAELGIKAPAAPDHDGPIAGVARGAAFLGWILLADEPRPEARDAVDDLRKLGLSRQLLVTGDRASVARRIAKTVNIADVRADALPATKMQFVLDEIKAGYRPLVVGDGINDALALKAGAVGIAMGAQGTDVALASADLVLMSSDLRRLGTSIRLSRLCRRTIHVNVAVGLGWTIVIIAGAASGVMGASGPIIAALLHNLGTFLVMANAGRLLKFQEVSPTSA